MSTARVTLVILVPGLSEWSSHAAHIVALFSGGLAGGARRYGLFEDGDVFLRVMYGIPADLPIRVFVGQKLNQVCLGRFQIQLHCSGTGSISVEGRWELRDDAGQMVDREEDHEQRRSYRIHRVIDVPVARFSIDPPRSFTLFFENGLALSVFDDSEKYESFSIHLDGKPSLHV